MGEVVLIVVGVAAAGVAGTGAVVIAGLRVVRRRVRLAGGPRVPLRWAVSPRQTAHLHRRLRRVDQAAAVLTPRRRRRRTDPLPSQELAAQVRDAARALDAELVHVARLHPTARRTHLERIRTNVAHLERSTAQLHAVAGQASVPVADVTRLAAQVTTFTDAHRELDTPGR